MTPQMSEGDCRVCYIGSFTMPTMRCWAKQGSWIRSPEQVPARLNEVWLDGSGVGLLLEGPNEHKRLYGGSAGAISVPVI